MFTTMSTIKVNLNNLTECEKKQLLDLVKKANASTKLSDIDIGETFKIGDVTFIKFSDINGTTFAVTKDLVFNSSFGDDNNFANSRVLERLNKEFLPKIIDIVGNENLCDIHTHLTTLDGLKPYPELTSKISLPTLNFYRDNVKIFDESKVNAWWWLCTPESAQPHDDPYYTLCVSPSGVIDYGGSNNCIDGVRPLLCFVSSISVSCEE